MTLTFNVPCSCQVEGNSKLPSVLLGLTTGGSVPVMALLPEHRKAECVFLQRSRSGDAVIRSSSCSYARLSFPTEKEQRWGWPRSPHDATPGQGTHFLSQPVTQEAYPNLLESVAHCPPLPADGTAPSVATPIRLSVCSGETQAGAAAVTGSSRVVPVAQDRRQNNLSNKVIHGEESRVRTKMQGRIAPSPLHRGQEHDQRDIKAV